MPFSTGAQARIRTNSSAELAYNAMNIANKDIARSQLKLSTGLRINNASDDVAGYITSRALGQRNNILKASLKIAGDARNVANITMDALENISDMVREIRTHTATATSGAMGTAEKVALAKSAFRFAQQIQTIVDSSVFGGRQIIDGSYSANFFVGTNATNNLLTISLDLSSTNSEFDVDSGQFNTNALLTSNFGGVTGLNLNEFNDVVASDLGIFNDENIGVTLTSLAFAIDNITKVGSYVGGISNRIDSQEDVLQQQIVNYDAAISRIQDTDVAKTQLQFVRDQFLQQASLTSLAQANQNPGQFLQLLSQ
ncbi:flagellin [Candidatus Kapabacteria bacterium]|nr:flagellin [Candidatus Kapabacteria bacterium]